MKNFRSARKHRRLSNAIAVGATPFFADNFANGQLNPANGFTYLFNGGNPQLSTAQTVNGGTHSLRMAYGPDAIGADSSCEVRFRLGRLIRSVWVEYWMYVPSNFYMRETVNNKFFALWRDWTNNSDGNWSYSRTDYPRQQFTLEYWGLGGPWAQATTRVSARVGGVLVTDLNMPTNQTNLIGGPGPMNIGAWNRVRMQFTGSSATNVSDGAYKMWINDTTKHYYLNAPLWNPTERLNGGVFESWTPPSEVLYDVGYFMGYANTGFTELTEFFIGDIKFYDTDPGWG